MQIDVTLLVRINNRAPPIQNMRYHRFELTCEPLRSITASEVTNRSVAQLLDLGETGAASCCVPVGSRWHNLPAVTTVRFSRLRFDGAVQLIDLVCDLLGCREATWLILATRTKFDSH